MDKVIVIGDSHSLLFSERGNWVDPRLNNMFDVKWLGPVTFWRFCRDKNTCIDLESISNGRTVLFSFGEIDIRCHIINHIETTYQDVIDKMMGELETYLSNNSARLDLHFMSVPPPMYKDLCTSPNKDFPFVGSDEYRSEITKYFNSKLKEMVERHNIGYFDCYGFYCDENNMLDYKKSDTVVHAVKTKELEDYVKNYFINGRV